MASIEFLIKQPSILILEIIYYFIALEWQGKGTKAGIWYQKSQLTEQELRWIGSSQDFSSHQEYFYSFSIIKGEGTKSLTGDDQKKGASKYNKYLLTRK